MKEIRTRVRAVILGITGILVVLILLRLVLQLTGANPSQPIISIILSLSEPLVSPFREFNNFLNTVGTDTAADVSALMVTIVGGLLVTDLVTSFLYDNISDIVMNLVDFLFKTLEALLIIRLVLRLFGIPIEAGWFVADIYNSTQWASGVFPEIKLFSGALEISTLVILIIVAVIDFSTEGLVRSVRNNRKRSEIAVKQAAPLSPPPAPAPKTVVMPAAQPMQQHITINVPVPPAAPPQPQVINVQAPPPAAA